MPRSCWAPTAHTSATCPPWTGTPEFDLGQDFLEHGYKELTIPARKGEFALDPDALHIWPRGGSMMIALPNLDRSFTCTLFWPEVRTGQLCGTRSSRPAAATVSNACIPTSSASCRRSSEDYALNPIGSLVTVRCWPWVIHGAESILALVGDAAHAIVPFFGQGANCAFEDCIEIDRRLSEAHERLGSGPHHLSATTQGEHRRHRRSGARQFRGNAGPSELSDIPSAHLG